jgi:hypothetical protein
MTTPPLFSKQSRDGYVADIMRNYGDRGQPMHIPNVDHDVYARGLAFREREKQQYMDLRAQLEQTTAALKAERARTHRFAKHIARTSQFLENMQGANAAAPGVGGGHSDGNRKHDVLSAAHRAGQDDSYTRQPEALISSTPATDVSSANRSRSVADLRDSSERERPGENGGANVVETDAGREHAPEPAVDRPADQHADA